MDELGYPPMAAHRANRFFQLASHLYTRVSLVVTPDVSFDAWGPASGGDEAIASASLDRLLCVSYVALIAGPSNLMKGKLTHLLEQSANS